MGRSLNHLPRYREGWQPSERMGGVYKKILEYWTREGCTKRLGRAHWMYTKRYWNIYHDSYSGIFNTRRGEQSCQGTLHTELLDTTNETRTQKDEPMIGQWQRQGHVKTIYVMSVSCSSKISSPGIKRVEIYTAGVANWTRFGSRTLKGNNRQEPRLTHVFKIDLRFRWNIFLQVSPLT
jgi:hypothetical protein